MTIVSRMQNSREKVFILVDVQVRSWKERLRHPKPSRTLIAVAGERLGDQGYLRSSGLRAGTVPDRQHVPPRPHRQPESVPRAAAPARD